MFALRMMQSAEDDVSSDSTVDQSLVVVWCNKRSGEKQKSESESEEGAVYDVRREA